MLFLQPSSSQLRALSTFRRSGQNSRRHPRLLLLSHHTSSLRVNTLVLPWGQFQHPVSSLYPHYYASGLSESTMISHLNWCNHLPTGLLCSHTLWWILNPETKVVLLKWKLGKLTPLLKVSLNCLRIKGNPSNSLEAQQCLFLSLLFLSPLFPELQPHWRLAVLRTHHTCSHFRSFALPVS